MRVAYFTNVYPNVSHTFIRREIRALETLGMTVLRYALRPGEIFDSEDIKEKEQTRYIFRAGAVDLFCCCLAILLTRPLAVCRATR